MKQPIFLLALMLPFGYAIGQEDEMPSEAMVLAKVNSINYFTYNYKYLDKNFVINIPDSVFQNTVSTYEFFPHMIKAYNDSLGVVLMAEFKDYDYSRVAKLRLTYTWLRLGYHLWLSEEETRNLANQYGFHHPYLFREFLGKLELEHDAHLQSFLNDLRAKLLAHPEVKPGDFKSGSIEELLNLAFLKSPGRMKDWNKLMEEKSKSKKVE